MDIADGRANVLIEVDLRPFAAEPPARSQLLSSLNPPIAARLGELDELKRNRAAQSVGEKAERAIRTIKAGAGRAWSWMA
jgi:hypothetical protein